MDTTLTAIASNLASSSGVTSLASNTASPNNRGSTEALSSKNENPANAALDTKNKAVSENQDTSTNLQAPETQKSDANEPAIPSETRKTEVQDGELTVKVYDNNGKLIRQIPPGYVPAKEQQINIIT